MEVHKQELHDLQERHVQQALADMGGLEWIFNKVSTKVKNSNINASKNMLIGQVAATANTRTAEPPNRPQLGR